MMRPQKKLGRGAGLHYEYPIHADIKTDNGSDRSRLPYVGQ